MNRERIDYELGVLLKGGQRAQLVEGARAVVLYHEVPAAGALIGLPDSTDVIVPVPPAYPGGLIDLAGLPKNSPLLARVAGGKNNQGEVTAMGQVWQLASYHPHNGGGGPPWNPSVHGFHTYLDQLIAWLHRLN